MLEPIGHEFTAMISMHFASLRPFPSQRSIIRCGAAVPLLIWFLSTVVPMAAQPYRDPDESRFEIRSLEFLNSDEDDYGPFLTANTRWLYFTTSRTGKAKLVRSQSEGAGWGEIERTPGAEVNTDVDDGVFSAPVPALAQLYRLDDEALTRLAPPTLGIMASGKRNLSATADFFDADLYLFDLTPDGGVISNVRDLDQVNTLSMESQPTIAPDGSFIIFVADRSNGDDEKDLYISYRGSDGRYAAPVSLGEPINSDAREVSPFIAPDGQTLFFASDRDGGFGGADLYVSRRDRSGRWSEPKNLGNRINTSANELFFYGVGRDRCFFVSDREGGKGGFDLYEAAPNIFAAGFSMLRVVLMDSVSGRQVEGSVKISETVLGRSLAETPVGLDRPAETPVVSGIGYMIEANALGYNGSRRLALADVPPDTTVTVVLSFGRSPAPSPPPPAVVFNIEGINVPLFVSGYYRLNTPALLDDLRQRQREGNLRGLTYIADVTGEGSYGQYARMARNVQGILNDFSTRCVNEYFPGFLKTRSEGEVLEVTVHGYADPRPITGIYAEGPVSFFDSDGGEIRVATGETLDNRKLAGLRAYYAVQYLDGVFRERARSADYLRMIDQGLIRWRVVSGSVDETSGGDDLSQKRRIRVDFRRVPSGSSLK